MSLASLAHKHISAPTEWHQHDPDASYSNRMSGHASTWYARHFESYLNEDAPISRSQDFVGLVRQPSWEHEEEVQLREDIYSAVFPLTSRGFLRRQPTEIRSIRPSDAVDYISAGVFDLIQSTIRRAPERDNEFGIKLRELLQEHFSEYDRQAIVSELIPANVLLAPSELSDTLILGSAGHGVNVLESMRAASELIGLPFGDEIRYPDFQFDVDRSHVRSVVAKINVELDAADDPWGVAAWWYSENARLDTRPVDLLDVAKTTVGGADDEDLTASNRLLAAAKAVTEPVG